MQEIVNALAVFGGLFSFVLGLGQLMVRHKNKRNYSLVMVLWALAIILLSMYLNYIDAGLHLFLHYLFLPCLFAIGPLFFVYFFASVEKSFRLDRRYLLFFIPVGVAFLFVLFDSTIGGFEDYPLAFFEGKRIHVAEQSVTLAFIINLGYYMVIYIRARTVIKYSFLEREPSTQFFLTTGWLSAVITLIAMYAMLLREIWAIKAATSLITFGLAYAYLVMQRHPQLFQEFHVALEGAKMQKYTKSQLTGIDLPALQAGLKKLMEEEQIYRDETLSLASLASLLNLSPHQLSEYLNKHLQNNFAQFVNQYRIDEAKDLLAEDRDANILSVTYRVGFNSKSAFNVSFQKLTGMTPTEYRQKTAGQS